MINHEFIDHPNRSLRTRITLAFSVIGLFVSALVLSGCASKTLVVANYHPSEINAIEHSDAVLKAHLRNGELLILTNWVVHDSERKITGDGTWLNLNRVAISSGPQVISLDSVALFETNALMPSPGAGALTLMTGVSLAVTVYCITNPKACFGSCPTFYFDDEDGSHLVAEGFSSSVAPALEASDLDALGGVYPTDNELSLTMTNEALETHVIRQVELLAVPVSSGDRVFADQDRIFWTATNLSRPTRCDTEGSDILPLIIDFDSKEYFSSTDSVDLGAREEIAFDFHPTNSEKKGIVLSFRQTLLTTYLFYQTLSYMGSNAGAYLSALERGNNEALSMAGGLGDALGGIEIFAMASDDQWVVVGEVYETGPIATDCQVVPIPVALEKATRFKIRMARGNWRLDYLALAELGEKTEAVTIKPARIMVGEQANDSILMALNDPELQVVTMPGDRMKLVFELPPSEMDWELFLDSRGYYLEWMRDEWLADENPLMLAQILTDPQSAIRILAPQYKKVESEMETLFWNSKYVR